MAEYKQRRVRKRANGRETSGEGHGGSPPTPMIIMIAVAKKKPASESVDGKPAKHHLGKRARGGSATKPLDARQAADPNFDGLDKVPQGSGTQEREMPLRPGRLDGGMVMMARGGYDGPDTRSSGGATHRRVSGAHKK